MTNPANNHIIVTELQWLKEVFSGRLSEHYDPKNSGEGEVMMDPPLHEDQSHPYAKFLETHRLNQEERLILILALAPHVQPNFLDEIILQVVKDTGDFPQLGGTRGKSFRGLIPTLETAFFILAGNDLGKRFEVQKMFKGDHIFTSKGILEIEQVNLGEPLSSGILLLDQEYIDLLTTGIYTKPNLSASFPAQLLTTELEWDDLVLNEQTDRQIKDLEIWIKHHHRLMIEWGMKRRLSPGYRALFYGPSGTGKTLTTSLLGKYAGKDVYRIDLSLVISKFIGETEKNLASLFDKAKNKDWILFFDEADSLFGKRTSIRDAHDKYANQEVAYLLQRIETFPGLVILASNFRSNIDEAFTRRFQSIIYFPVPRLPERLRLWEKAFPKKVKLEDRINLKQIARDTELTGANIMNIVQYACLQTLAGGGKSILYKDLMEGIKREYSKEGKLI